MTSLLIKKSFYLISLLKKLILICSHCYSLDKNINMEVDLAKGIDELLFHSNVNILCLLLREGSVETEFVIERAKKLYVTRDEIWGTAMIDFFCDAGMMYDQ